MSMRPRATSTASTTTTQVSSTNALIVSASVFMDDRFSDGFCRRPVGGLWARLPAEAEEEEQDDGQHRDAKDLRVREPRDEDLRGGALAELLVDVTIDAVEPEE